MPSKSWFSVKAMAAGEAEVFIYDEIGGWGIFASDFIRAVKDAGAGKLTVRINSPGGEVFQGIAIYNYLRTCGAEVTTVIDGMAASIASVVAMAGNTVRMASNAFLFLHNPGVGIFGNSSELRDMAEWLDKLSTSLVSSYAAKSGADVKTIQEWMDNETTFSAAEAKAAGLCDEISGPVEARNSFDLSRYKNLSARVGAGQPKKDTMTELLKALVAAGLVSQTTTDDAALAAEVNSAVCARSKEADERVKAAEDRAATAEAALAKYKEDAAIAAVDAAAATGKITNDAATKARWVKIVLATPEALSDIPAASTPKAGVPPLPPAPAQANEKTDANGRPLKGLARVQAAFKRN